MLATPGTGFRVLTDATYRALKKKAAVKMNGNVIGDQPDSPGTRLDAVLLLLLVDNPKGKPWYPKVTFCFIVEL